MPDNDCMTKIIDELEERRKKMSIEELDEIANHLEQRVYQNIGHGVVNRLLWIIGLLAVSVFAYLEHKGVIIK